MQDRSKYIGASDIAGICNLSPWENATTIWLKKTGQSQEKEETEEMYWGKSHEPTIAARFFRDNPQIKCVEANKRIFHPEYDFISCEIDRVFEQDGEMGVLEIKTTKQFKAKEWDDGKAPEHYQMQIQFQMMLSGYTKAKYAVLIGGSDYRTGEVVENKELQALMLSAACNFWFNYVVPKKAPPLVDPDLETCKALYPTSNGNQITIADQAALIPTLLDLKVEIKELEKKEAELTAALQAIVGPNEIAITNDGQYVISWAEIERKGYEVKPTKYRKFSVKATKQKLIGGK